MNRSLGDVITMLYDQGRSFDARSAKKDSSVIDNLGKAGGARGVVDEERLTIFELVLLWWHRVRFVYMLKTVVYFAGSCKGGRRKR